MEYQHAPLLMKEENEATFEEEFLRGEGFLMKLKTNLCCRFCCCQPNLVWTGHPYKEELGIGEAHPTMMTIVEESSKCGRTMAFCMPGNRAILYRLYEGNIEEDHEQLPTPRFTIQKDATCPVNVFIFDDNGRIPCCFWLPYFSSYRGESQELLGTVRYICQPCLFVPKFTFEDEMGVLTHRLEPDTCCFGCCVLCLCEGSGAKCCRVPFYLRQPDDGSKIDEAHISDLWAGMKKECCTRQNLYQVKFPQNATDSMRVNMLASTLLLDLIFFEQEGR
jgi:hypothetical protein